MPRGKGQGPTFTCSSHHSTRPSGGVTGPARQAVAAAAAAAGPAVLARWLRFTDDIAEQWRGTPRRWGRRRRFIFIHPSGRWRDLGGRGCRGDDLVALVGYLDGVSVEEAARRLAAELVTLQATAGGACG